MAEVEFTINNCTASEVGAPGRAPGHVRKTSTQDYVHFKNLDAKRKCKVTVPSGVLEGFPPGGKSLDKFPTANSGSLSYKVIGGIGPHPIGITGPDCPITTKALAPQIIIDD